MGQDASSKTTIRSVSARGTISASTGVKKETVFRGVYTTWVAMAYGNKSILDRITGIPC
jgi:signal recognition particle receptor subunit beta